MASLFSDFFLRFGKDCIDDGRRSTRGTTSFVIAATDVMVLAVDMAADAMIGGASCRREERSLGLLMGAKAS